MKFYEYVNGTYTVSEDSFNDGNTLVVRGTYGYYSRFPNLDMTITRLDPGFICGTRHRIEYGTTIGVRDSLVYVKHSFEHDKLTDAILRMSYEKFLEFIEEQKKHLNPKALL